MASEGLFGSKVSDKFLGLFFILCVALIWVAASFLVSSLEEPDRETGDPKLHPFVLTWIANSLFVIYLPIAGPLQRWSKACTGDSRPDTPQSISPGFCDLSVENGRAEGAGGTDDVALLTDGVELSAIVPDDTKKGRRSAPTGMMSFKDAAWRRHATAAATICPVWFMAQLGFNLSLEYTSVTSNTILSTPSSLLTFVASVLVLGEKFEARKVVSILLCAAGTILVTVSDGSGEVEEGKHPLAGDVLTLCSAMLYAAYTVGLKVLLPEDASSNMGLFFGLMGLFNLCLFTPILLLLQVVHAVDVTAMTGYVLGMAILKGLFDNVLSDYLWARAVLLVGPTVASVGLSIQVPIAMLVDPLIGHAGWLSAADTTVLTLLGAGLVLLGFYSINVKHPLPSWCGGARSDAPRVPASRPLPPDEHTHST